MPTFLPGFVIESNLLDLAVLSGAQRFAIFGRFYCMLIVVRILELEIVDGTMCENRWSTRTITKECLDEEIAYSSQIVNHIILKSCVGKGPCTTPNALSRPTTEKE